MNNKKGFTLIEALISLVIVGFVVVSILNGFSYQQLNSKNTLSKNLAVSLAEAKLEEILKYPGSELPSVFTPPSTNVDYIVQTANSLLYYTSDPGVDKQFRRTCTITQVGNLINIEVTIDYGKVGNTYPFQITLSTQRGG